MEVLAFLAIIIGILSSISKAAQKQKQNGTPVRPRVTEARAPESEQDEQADAQPKPQVRQTPRQAPHIRIHETPRGDILVETAARDVARDESGTITATKRTDLVSRLTDTAVERAKNEKPMMRPLDERPMAVSSSVDEPSPMPDALRSDLLRGIVMSEILTRPCQRKPVWRRS